MARSLALAFAWLLACAAFAGAADAKKKLLVIGQGPDGHPPTTHEFIAGNKIIAALLEKQQGVEVTVVDGSEPFKDGHDQILAADGVVIFVSEGAKWAQRDPRRWDALTRLAARGGGVVALHWGVGTKEAEQVGPWLKVLGGCHGGPDRKYQVLETELRPASPQHEIAAGLKPLRVKDEFYYQLKFVKAETKVEPVMEATIDDKQYPVCWAWQREGGGRSFGFTGLHFHENWKHETYRRLVAQGILWTLKQPIPKDGLPVDIKDELLKLPEVKPAKAGSSS